MRRRRAILPRVVAPGFLLLAMVVLAATAGPALAQAVPPAGGSQLPEVVQGPPAAVEKHPKLDSQLLAAARGHTSSAAPAGTQSLSQTMGVQGDRVRVVVETTGGEIALPGAVAEGRSGNLIQATVPVAALETLAAQPGVVRVRPPFKALPAAVAGEEVVASGANAWQAGGYSGAGVKVGIIDLGFQDYTLRQADGDLPPTGPGSLVTQNFGCSPGIEDGEVHGAAVAEIVHEMAPAAELHLICVQTEVDLGLAEAYAKAQGIQIVNHSVAWFNSSRGDGSGGPGTPDAIVADARAN